MLGSDILHCPKIFDFRFHCTIIHRQKKYEAIRRRTFHSTHESLEKNKIASRHRRFTRTTTITAASGQNPRPPSTEQHNSPRAMGRPAIIPPTSSSNSTGINRKSIIGYCAKLTPHSQRRLKDNDNDILGIVRDVLDISTTGASHPLLKIIGTRDGYKEQHLIPFVKSIVPNIDTTNKIIYLAPPDGLIDLGRRRSLLQRIDYHLKKIQGPIAESTGNTRRRSRLNTAAISTSSDATNNNGMHTTMNTTNTSPNRNMLLMPTRRTLEKLNRKDLVRLIQSAGGFLEVAQTLGYSSTRRPPGYWENEATLDREISLFVAANWIQFEDESDEESESESDSDTYMQGNIDTISTMTHASNTTTTIANEKRVPVKVPSITKQHKDVYWYNQVTRRVQWIEPAMPEVVPIDNDGSVVLTDSYEDRAMPSRNSVQAAGRYDLHAAIEAAGGYTSVREQLDRWPAWPVNGHLRNMRTLLSELKEFIREHKLPPKKIPPAQTLQNAGRNDLHKAILWQGGYITFAEQLKWQTQRKHQGAWEDLDAVAEQVLEFAKKLANENPRERDDDGSRPLKMPTHEQFRAAGRHDLRHAVQRHGSAVVAEKTGLVMSDRGGRRRKQEWVDQLALEHAEWSEKNKNDDGNSY